MSQQITSALTLEQIYDRAPSVFATEPFERMSDRYAFVPTSRIVEKMQESGFMPVRVNQSLTRIEGKGDFTKHMIRFRHTDYLGTTLKQVGDEYPEIVLVNSHDGSSAFQLHVGLFRLVCLNGMICPSTNLGQVKIRHTGNVVNEVIEGSYSIIEETPQLMDHVNAMKEVLLQPQEQKVFAEAAIDLRYDRDEHGNSSANFQPDQLLKPKRYYYGDDAKPTLWNTFNNIQENFMKGGLRGRSAPTEQNSRGRRSTSRAINSVSQDLKLNRSLWSLAEKMKEIKLAA